LEEGDGVEQVTEEGDRERVKRWLGGDRWRIREGLDRAWEDF